MKLSKILGSNNSNRTIIKRYHCNGKRQTDLLNDIFYALKGSGFKADRLATTVCVNGYYDNQHSLSRHEAEKVFECLVEFGVGDASISDKHTISVNVVYDPFIDVMDAYCDGEITPVPSRDLYPNGAIVTCTSPDVAVGTPTDSGEEFHLLPDYVRNNMQAKDFLSALDTAYREGVAANERKRELRACHLHFFDWIFSQGCQLVFPRAPFSDKQKLAENYDEAVRCYKALTLEEDYTVLIDLADEGIKRLGAVMIKPSNTPHETITDFSDNDLLNAWHYAYSKYLEDTQYMVE